MPSDRLVDRVRLHQVDVPLGHRRQPCVVTVQHVQLCLGEILDVDHPVARPVECGHDLEGDRLLVCTGEGSLKAKNTRRDPRVALSIVDLHDPYMEAQLRGRIVERRPDPDLRFMDPISYRYTGKPFPFRNPEGRVALVIEIDKARYTKLPFEHMPVIRSE
jgi:Pyridoxamine 5'-phosphate oxidase